jgi:histidinol-phosphate aminotransferase
MKRSVRDCLRPEVLSARAYGIEEPEGLIKLDANENPYPPPPAVMNSLAELCRELQLNRYPDPGADRLREALAEKLDWEKDGLLLGNGSDELIGIICTACGHGSAKMLVPVPTFVMYRIIGSVGGWEVDEVPLDEDFELDGGEIVKRLRRDKPRLVVIASPNNPTGNSFDEKVVLEIIEEAPGIVVLDEAYYDFSGKTFLGQLKTHPNLLILRTLSKVGLAALRVGMLLGNPSAISELNKVRLPYNVSAFSQGAALAVLENGDFLDEEIRTIVGERKRLVEEMRGLEGIRTFSSDANFILFRSLRERSGDIFTRIREGGVLIRDLGGPGPLENCLRVTVGTPEENSAFLGVLRADLG